jgi:hypothetical protein
MANDTHLDLSHLADAYARHANLSHWRVSFLATGNGQFFKGLKEGRSCTLRTAEKVFFWFSDHWPTDLEWPTDIPRPEPKKEVA